MSRLVLEFRTGVRAIARRPFVATLVVLAFALGLGVVSAVFSVLNGVLLRPLPYPEPERLVAVYDVQPACATCPASFPKYHDWRARNRVFAAIGGSNDASFVLSGQGEPVRIDGVATTASLVDVFEIPPRLGRWYTEEEDRPGGPKVVVLSHGFWQRQKGSDPRAVGSRLVLDGESHEVIGVMPEGFSHRDAELYVPLQQALDPTTRGSHFLAVYARLRPDTPLDRARAEMRALGQSLQQEFDHNHGIDLRSLTEVAVGGVRAPLYLLLGAVTVVLLIACANVANLLLAASVGRRREFALRAALGARLRDLGRQLVVEALVLAGIGGVLGLVLAHGLVRAFVTLAGSQLPRAGEIAIDGRVLAFTAVLTLLVALACGLAPLLMLRSRELVTEIRDGDTRTAAGRGGLGGGLVVVEVALASALLVGAGLLAKNLEALRGRDAGVRTERIVSVDVSASGPRYQADPQVLSFYRELHLRARALPGVESVGLTSHLPMHRYGWNSEYSVEGDNPWRAEEAPLVENRWVHGAFFETLGIPLLSGRGLDDRDGPGSRTVLINRAMADKFWPGADPLGRRFGSGDDRSKWYDVVGVVGDVRSFGLARSTPFEMYRTISQAPFRWGMSLVVRTAAADPLAVVASLRQVVRSVDPALPVTDVQTMEQVVAASVGRPRFWSALVGLFGALAGLLAAVGVYGVLAYEVRRLTRELGIRQALGADPGALRALVLGRGLRLAAAGVALGTLGALPLTGVLRSLLNDVSPRDPAVFVATVVGVLAVAVLACLPSALAAGRVEPAVALRDLA